MPALPFGRHWSGATAGPHCHYVPASVTSAISFESSLPPVRWKRIHLPPRSRVLDAMKRFSGGGDPADYVAPAAADHDDKALHALRKKNPNPRFLQNHHQWLKQFGRDKVHDQIQRVFSEL